MKKLTKIIAGVTAVVLSFGIFSGCAKKTSYPKFVNNESSSTSKREKYNVHVLSVGGAKLDNVKVTVKSPDGKVLRRSISSNGLIELDLPLAEYTLELDDNSLPAGYYADVKTYKTNPNTREDVEIRLSSRLIGANESGCTYTVGSIMRDFTFTDFNGKKHTLSDILYGTNGVSKKSAVVLNFFYTGCPPCRAEFPAIQRAYEMHSSDVEILAICSTHQGDTNSKVKEFAEEQSPKLSFPMGIDDLGLNNAFGVAAYPTTYIIDRYGMIAYRTVGGESKASVWDGLFSKFASSSYVQDIGGDGGGDPGESTEMVKPNVTMPSSAEMDIAASLAGSPLKASYRNDESEFSWPWQTGADDEGSYICSSNKGVDNSFSMVYAAGIEMKKDQVLMFEYKVDSETNNDLLHVTVDGLVISGDGWSGVTDWTSCIAYVADRDKTVELTFTYMKDRGDPDEFKGEDQAKIRNILIAEKSSITEPTDILRTCASGEEVIDGTKVMYSNYVDVVLGDDGFYHKDTKNGPLIMITINNVTTPWNDLHSGNVSEDASYYNSLYGLTYNKYAETEENNFKVVIDGTDLTNTVIIYRAICDYMEEPYYLMPVNEQLKLWAEKVADRYEQEMGSATHDKEWLEFCYYYDHYGAQHDPAEEKNGHCRMNTDITRGLTIYNSYTAYEKNDTANLQSSEMYNAETGRIKAVINFPLQVNNGSYYKFVPTETGVYNIRSYTKGCGSSKVSPTLHVMDKDGTIIGTSIFVRDFDAKITEEEGRVDYEGFNYNIVLQKDVPVFLFPMADVQTTGYYDFEVTYMGTSYKKMYVASTFAGVWESATRYEAINVIYDSSTDCWYKEGRDQAGNPVALMDQPIYVSMVHESFLYSEAFKKDPATGDIESSTYKPVEWLIEAGCFNGLKDAPVSVMRQVLADAKENKDGIVDEHDNPIYGLVKATSKVVNLLNAFVDEYIDGGRGEGNAWLTFACYMEIWQA